MICCAVAEFSRGLHEGLGVSCSWTEGVALAVFPEPAADLSDIADQTCHIRLQ